MSGSADFVPSSLADLDGTIPESRVDNLAGDLAALATAVTARLVAASNLSDLASIATARTNLGLGIGVDVQAWDADLDTLAGLGKTKGNLIAASGSAWAALAVGGDGQVLTADAASANGVKWAAAGGGAPGGSSTQLQYNSAGSFGGVANVTRTANGNLALAAQTTPGSTVDGELYQGTQKTLTATLNGLTHRFVGCLFSQTADQTIGNTTTETTLFGSGVGAGLTLPANFLVAGKTIRLKLHGYLAAASGNYQVKLKLGGVTLYDSGTLTLNVSTAMPVEIDALITCRATGTTNTVIGTLMGKTYIFNALRETAGATFAPANVDTTASGAIDCTWKFSAAAAGNTITIHTATVEVLN